MEKYGGGCSSVRFIFGSQDIHKELEEGSTPCNFCTVAHSKVAPRTSSRTSYS